ncbi:MAG: hypothetical protein KAH44_08415 [Oricola sp.]|nr:hypothetical protein [Oricola sp.]
MRTITIHRAATRNALRVIAAMTAVAAIAGQAQAANHTDRVSCYFYVNDGCYNHSPNCTRDEYESLLENCDTEYPFVKTRSLRGPKTFKLQ